MTEWQKKIWTGDTQNRKKYAGIFYVNKNDITLRLLFDIFEKVHFINEIRFLL